MKIILFSLATMFAFSVTSAKAEVYSCPDAIMVTEAISDIAPGFSAWNDTYKGPPALGAAKVEHMFKSLGISDGAPSERVWLDDGEKNGKSSWDFSANYETAWLSCYYKETSAVLSRELPKPTKSCVYSQKDRQASIVCK